MKQSLRKIAVASVLSALICVATMIVKVPTPLKGYANLGDCVVLIAGWLLPPGYGFLAAGIGSGLADVFSGYAIYAPATFVIKGLMALICFLLRNSVKGKAKKELPVLMISGFVAEVIMVVGYYVFEGFVYGWSASLVNIPANAIQGVIGLVAGVTISSQLLKIKGLQTD